MKEGAGVQTAGPVRGRPAVELALLPGGVCPRGPSSRCGRAPSEHTGGRAVEPLGEVHLVAISKLPVTVPLRPARGLPPSSAQMAPSSQPSTSVRSCHPRSRPPLLTRPAPSSSLGRGFSPEDAAHPRPEDHSPPVLACLRARSPPHLPTWPGGPAHPLCPWPTSQLSLHLCSFGSQHPGALNAL